MRRRADVRTIGPVLTMTVVLAAALTGCTSGPAAAPASSSATPTLTASAVTTPASPLPTPTPITPSPSTPAPTKTVTAASSIVLSSKGIGALAFGSAEKDVLAFLKPALGTPKVQGQVGGCEDAGSGYQSYATFGDLSVRFAAKDNSAKSPRTMQSWNLTFKGAPKAPLALAKEIPVGKTLAQLKSLYPKGGGLEHMGAWAAAGVVIVPPEAGGETMVHAGGLDWCT